ncbi:MAG: 50S ribosomal protein L29 [Rhodocyclaceae bacterium]|nr:50S ribosomal protein L29 [Rhodocyclaceae bacterium]
MKAIEHISQMRQKNEADLEKELLDLRRAQFSLRMQLATQQTTNTSQLGKARRDIARIKTLQRERVAAK